MRGIKNLTERWGIPLVLDACRVVENAYFVKKREREAHNRSIEEIVREFFSLSDIAFMSAKKDGLANIGGFIVTGREDWAQRIGELLILWEGFLTYGGLSGRDLEAIATGLEEAMDEAYLSYRIDQVAYLAQELRSFGIPVLWPPGGHAVYIDAGSWLPHIKKENFPGQALVVALYLEGGVRGVEVGSLMFGESWKDKREMVRLAIPRRVYTRSHLDYVVSSFESIKEKREKIRGLRIVWEPPFLRHFSARLEPVSG
jgi:tryptophanase